MARGCADDSEWDYRGNGCAYYDAMDVLDRLRGNFLCAAFDFLVEHVSSADAVDIA